MTEAWKQWEGQTVNGELRLGQYLGGSENSAVFLTEHGERDARKTAIKLLALPPEESELQLCQWELAAKLSHPHLMQLFQIGHCQLGEMALLAPMILGIPQPPEIKKRFLPFHPSI